MINWMNEYDGFLMVVITFVYVIATCIICIFNGKSAKASREQVEVSQKHQEQNIGLQLYAIRKEVINKLSKLEIEEVYWDIDPLFNQDISDEFARLSIKSRNEKTKMREIEEYERDLAFLIPFTNNLTTVREDYIKGKFTESYEELISGIYEKCQKVEFKKATDDYVENVNYVKEKHAEIDADLSSLIPKMQTFLKNSIS